MGQPCKFLLQNCGLNKKFLPIGGITIDILIKKKCYENARNPRASSLPVLSHSAICFSECYKMKFANLVEICFTTFGSERVKLYKE